MIRRLDNSRGEKVAVVLVLTNYLYSETLNLYLNILFPPVNYAANKLVYRH